MKKEFAKYITREFPNLPGQESFMTPERVK
jgi:hypothetical protein